MKTSTRLFIATAISILLLWGLWFAAQKPRLSLNTQQFGLILTKPYYRSWLLSFSDGQEWKPNGRSVVIDEAKGTVRYGYRLIPRFSHADMRQFMKAHPETKTQ